MTRPIFTAMLLGSAVFCSPALAAPDAPAAESGAERMTDEDRNTIVVTGARPRTESLAGTKSAAPIAETPQSISVISSADIANLGIANLNQALRFVAGVTTEQRGSSAEVYDQFKLRGFDAPQFLDGLKLDGGAGYLAPQVDMSRLDRIDIVKGPASVLYGQSGPGGLVALTSKMPLDQDFYGAVSGTYGTYDLYRADADIGGSAGASIHWRLYGSVNGAHTQQTFSRRERETISGAVTFDLDHATKLTVLGAYSHDPQNGSYGVFPASGTYLANPNGQLPTSRDFGEPGNFFKRDQVAGTYILTHQISPDWSVRASGRYMHATSTLGIVYASGSLVGPASANPNSTLYNRASYATRERADSAVFDNQLRGRFMTGTLKHDVLFGVDYQTGTANEVYAFGSATPLNGYAPVYGTMTVPRTPEAVPDPFYGSQSPRSNQAGIYAQDQISIGGLRVLLSGRQDWATVRTAPNAAAQNSEKFTYRAGALYTTSFGLAPYVSYSTSFEPNGTLRLADGSNITAKPSEGKQIEAGAKYTVPGTQILLTAAWFQIDQTNIIVTNPVTLVSSRGKYRSTGVEVEANAPLPYGFNARLAFSRQKVRNAADANPANVGDGILGVGRGGTSANLEWAPRGGGLKGFAIGGAVRHVDSIYAGSYTNAAGTLLTRQSTPGFTVFDGLIRYDLGGASQRLEGLALSVNAANLLDKKYVTTCYLDYQWCWYGNRRTVQGTLSYKW
ncbi:TonB-dependent siderophore receptor [soil metagenome]